MSGSSSRVKNNFSIFQLSKQINSFINTVGIDRNTNENNSEEHEYDKHDQVITKAESEARIIVLLSVITFSLNTVFLACILNMLIITKEPKLIQYPDPAVVHKLPYLQVLFKNGSNEIVSLQNTNLIHANFSFSEQDFYFYYHYKQQNSYIHGKFGSFVDKQGASSTEESPYSKNATTKIRQFCFHSILDSKALKLRKKKKNFYRKNLIDQFGNSRGFSPTHNLTTVQVGSYLWMLGGGYIGNNMFSLPKGSGPCYGSNVNCQVRNPDFLSDHFIKMCDCVLEDQTELWSMEKSCFIPSSLQLPFGFGMVSGCGIGLNRNIGLLIGGHYVKTDGMFNYPINDPINDQVLEFDISNGNYSMLQNVPLNEYMKSPGDIKYICDISYLKNTTRFIFVIAQKYTENNRLKSQTFIYYPESQEWTNQLQLDKTDTINGENQNVLFKYLGSLYNYGKNGLQVYSPFDQTWQETKEELNYDFNSIYAINTIYL